MLDFQGYCDLDEPVTEEQSRYPFLFFRESYKVAHRLLVPLSPVEIARTNASKLSINIERKIIEKY